MINKKNKKFVVEIKTNKNGWIRALLLKICKGYIILKLPSGDVIKKRNSKNIKFDKTKKVRDLTKSSPNTGKYFKTKKLKIKYLRRLEEND